MAVTTTKAVVVQIPNGEQWLDVGTYPFATTEEKQALMPDAKLQARLGAGRVLIRTIKVDDAGSTDETLWTTTVEDKLVVLPSVKVVNIGATLSEWARVRQVCMGQPWAEALIAAIDVKLGAD